MRLWRHRFLRDGHTDRRERQIGIYARGVNAIGSAGAARPADVAPHYSSRFDHPMVEPHDVAALDVAELVPVVVDK
jgi:hypothetical protein